LTALGCRPMIPADERREAFNLFTDKYLTVLIRVC